MVLGVSNRNTLMFYIILFNYALAVASIIDMIVFLWNVFLDTSTIIKNTLPSIVIQDIRPSSHPTSSHAIASPSLVVFHYDDFVCVEKCDEKRLLCHEYDSWPTLCSDRNFTFHVLLLLITSNYLLPPGSTGTYEYVRHKNDPPQGIAMNSRSQKNNDQQDEEREDLWWLIAIVLFVKILVIGETT